MAGSWNTTHSVLPTSSRSATANDTANLGLELFEKLLPSTIFFTVLICLGIPGNLLVFVVYLKEFKVSSTRIFVLAMASCDIIVGLVTVPVHIIYFRHMYTVGDNFCRVMFLLLKFPIVVSGWILVCASLDRRHRVCQPLRRQLSARQALYVLVVPLGLAILATVPFTPFKEKVEFTTVTGVSVQKCGVHSQLEVSGKIVRALEGGVLAVYCLVGLTLLVWAYGHILYRIKWQNKRLCVSLARDTTAGDSAACISSTAEVLAGQPETPKDTCDDTTEELCSSRDLETCDEGAEVNSSNQQAQRSKSQTREAIQEGRELTGQLHGARKSLVSQTTLVMFVLTVTNAVCLLPYVILAQFYDKYYQPHLSSWTMNLVIASNYLPSVRGIINPLIYLCFNPRFRHQCRRLLTGVSSFCR